MTLIREIVRECVRECVRGIEGISASPFPTADLTFLWTGQYDGTSLLNTKGANPTYVSGTGLDAIYDFSVLSDERLDKSNATYWGASLNAYFYYDAGNPYHYKLKDFHYRYFYNQMASDNNFVFGKFFYQNSLLQSVNFIAIYNIEKTESELITLLNYINIIDTFYGNDSATNMGSDNDTDFIDSNSDGLADDLSTINGVPSIDTGNGFIGRYQQLSADEVAVNATVLVHLSIKYLDGETFRLKFKHRSNNGIGVYMNDRSSNLLLNDLSSNELAPKEETFEVVAGNDTNTGYLRFYMRSTSGGTQAGDWLQIDECSLQQKFENYYSQESGLFEI